MRGGVTAIQCWGARSSSVATRRTWVASAGIAPSGARRLRQAGGAPTSAKPSRALRLRRRRRPTARRRRPGRTARLPTPRGCEEDRSRSLQSAGSRYHAERSTGGLLGTAAPAAHHRRAGRVEAERQPRARAVDPDCRPWCRLRCRLWSRSSWSLCRCRRSCSTCRDSTDHLVGGQVGRNAVRAEAFCGRPRRARRRPVCPTGVSMPALGFCSTIT